MARYRYRILERQEAGAWKSFGVAYKRRRRIEFVTLTWRAMTLDASSLEELSEEHHPSFGHAYRWCSEVEHAEREIAPIKLLQPKQSA